MFGLVPFGRNNNIRKRGNEWSVDNFFDDFFGDSFLPAFFSSGNAIKADLRETEKEYIIEAEVPGVDKKDIKLEINDDTLTVSVEKNEEVKEERKDYIKRERRYGTCSRSFYVGDVKKDKINAKYDKGILTVTLPKIQEGKKESRKIDIQ